MQVKTLKQGDSFKYTHLTGVMENSTSSAPSLMREKERVADSPRITPGPKLTALVLVFKDAFLVRQLQVQGT
eukprot:1161540-Pelagomonas_calceolata.AAC.20